MNKMQIFNSPVFGQVRTMEEDGKILFCAKDVAAALGYSNVRDAVNRHCRGVVKRDGVSYTTNQHGKETSQVTEMNFIPEGDVYRLIVRSKLPTAEKFERWVMDEVLPSIRQTGGYGNRQIETVLQQMEAVANTMASVAEMMTTMTADRTKQKREMPEQLVLEELRPRIKRHSVISHLDTELRLDVEKMICSDKFTYSDIVQHLADFGVKLSVASVCRYAKMMDA